MEIEVIENKEVKNITTFKIGGKVDKLWYPTNQKEFIHLLTTLENPLIFGSWSDVIISSEGIRGDVISTAKMKNFEIRGTKVYTDCGVKGPFLAQQACEKGLSGFEFMIGFPGTIGGNIFMNAGAHAQSISDNLVGVCVFDMKKKEIKILQKDELKFAYRHSKLQEKPYILLSAEFELKKAKKEDIKALVDRNLEFRKSHQPSLAIPNAGSVFKNPENDSAGRLLDKAGVKEFSCGGANVWEHHANFIVNTGNATSEDVLSLMSKMYDAVKEKYTIELKPEVKFFGVQSATEKEICEKLYAK